MEPSIVEGVEAYIVVDKPVHVIGEECRASILLRNASSKEKNVELLVRSTSGEIYKGSTMLSGFDEKVINIMCSSDNPGKNYLDLYVYGVKADHVHYLIVEDPGKDYYVAFVWHHHQAPNYYPDGVIHGPWAYVHVWENKLKPYGLGPYHYHALMLEKHAGFRTTYNLSPSLLAQWDKAIREGVVFSDGKRYEPDTREIELVRETLEKYRKALSRGQIDVLTSLYAHTIAGFLVEVLGMNDIVREEIEYGYKVTEKVMNNNYKPLGIWTPEMAFSMKLVPIYYDLGLKYTVLDDKHHFKGAKGNKKSPYGLYRVVDKSTSKEIYVFFRDHELSDIIGFKNTFNSSIHAWRSAYEFTYLIALKKLEIGSGILTIALDGENWMIFSKTPGLTAIFFEKMIEYMLSLTNTGYLKLATLRELYEKTTPIGDLTWIPTNTWLGSFRKWRGEIEEHEKYWVRAYKDYRMLRAYEEVIGKDNISSSIRWALWHALDSDYWWAEFWHPKVIDTWLKIVEEKLETVFNRITIKKLDIGRSKNECRCIAAIYIENKLDTAIKPLITLSSPCVEEEITHQTTIKPHSESRIEISFTPKYSGKCSFTVSLHASDYIIKQHTIEYDIEPCISPNPI